MKTLITSLFLLFSLTVFSHEGEIKHYNNGCQKGKFIKVDGEWKQHGIWKCHYAKARYNQGKLVWIQPKGDKRYTYEYIRMEQLSRKVERLETRLASTR
jgi:hypothetical protein